MPKISTSKKCSLSCKQCRIRKRKCDGNNPCSTCIAKNLNCQYVDIDKRSKRFQVSYVDALKRTNESLELSVKSLEAANDQKQSLFDNLLDNIDNHEMIIRLLKDSDNVKKNTNSDKSEDTFDPLLVSRENGTAPMVFGPTSVYNDGLITENNPHNPHNTEDNKVMSNHQQYELTHHQLKELNDYRVKYGYQNYKLFYFKETSPVNPVFRECISLFFKWMYSSLFLFIHRESFLYFFLCNELNCEFVSVELIYAICCLGARISPKPHIQIQADEFYNLAKRHALAIGDDKYFIRNPSICKLQTLLCLALYDLGRGELTSCWLLSGLAFRIGLDLGFELDPKQWNASFPIPKSSLQTDSPSLDNLTNIISKRELYQNYPFDINQLKSRIYWGSYVVDRLVCLVMGRPSTLKLTDVTIPDSQDIGDLTGIEDFIFYDNSSDRQYACRAFFCLKAVIELFGISDDILKKVFGSKILPGNGRSRLEVLFNFNLKLLKWKENLSQELFWNKSILKATAHNELYMGPRYTFFIIVLSVNRPFILMIALSSSKLINFEIVKMSIEICDDVIDDLEIVVNALEEQQSLHNMFCPHILVVYSVILAISLLLWRFKISQTVTLKNTISKKLEFFYDFLEKCSHIWPLASRPLITFRKRINELWLDVKKDQDNDYKPFEDSYSNDFAEFDLDHDNIDDIFQSVFEQPINQQILSRLDLADARWDEALYEGFL